MKRTLLVIAKRPVAGQTKTRLSPPLSLEQAAALYECFLRDTLDVARGVPHVTRGINYLPREAEQYFRALAPDFDLLLQTGNDLGERLDYALTHCLENGFDRAVIMDSDSPTLPADYLARAFNALDDNDVVLGPCADGGYYLIGLKKPAPRLFLEIKMSTPFVVRDTLELARQENLRAALLPEWYDVDTANELEQLRAELKRGAEDAPFTREFLMRYPIGDSRLAIRDTP